MSAEATLVVTRGGGFSDRLRAYKILVNGVEKVEIKAKSRVEIPVSADAHMVQATIDWTSSNFLLVTLAPGEVAEIEVSNTFGAWRAIWAISFGARNYLTLKQV